MKYDFFLVAVAGSLLLVILILAAQLMPHKRCAVKYDTPDDIGECVWLLQHGEN